MWLWRRRERFSLEELKFLTEQLQRTTYVNEYNKDSVVEVLRSIAELMIWGDERDPLFFEYFMEKQVMGMFIHILELSSTTTAVAVQLLQSVSIMIQNIRTDHAIYYIFSNGYLNYFITYPYDFRDEELLAYYISFLRTTSTKLDQTTISFFTRTENNEVVSFPLYTEGIKFFRHEESMVRIAVRTLTLNVYNVNDKGVRDFVTSKNAVGYITDVVKFLKEKSSTLHDLVTSAESMPDTKCIARLEGRVAETEEILDYCNDIVSAGIPDLARAMTENLMHHFVLPLLCSLASSSALCALYLLSRVLYTIRYKPLANGIAAALVCESLSAKEPTESTRENGVATSCPMELLLSQMVSDNDKVIVATVTFLLSLLHNEVDESILDVLGLLPRLKQHRRRLLQTLMGSNSDEDRLFDDPGDDSFGAPPFLIEGDGRCCNEGESDFKTECNIKCKSFIRMQEPVIKRLLELICKSPPPSVEALWRCGALLWQIFPYHQDDTVHSLRLEMIHNACEQAKETLLSELDDCWCDFVPSVLSETWRTSKKALEASQYREQATLFLMPTTSSKKASGDSLSSTAVAARMQSAVQVFVALYQLEQLLSGKTITEASPLDTALCPSSTVKVGTQLNLSSQDAFPCRVAFEKGCERSMYLIPLVKGRFGYLILSEENSARPGVVTARIVAPLAGCMPEVDEKHPKWLHFRIRPPELPSLDRRHSFRPQSNSMKRLDGRWTLAFGDVESCELAKQAVLKHICALKESVQQFLVPLLGD